MNAKNAEGQPDWLAQIPYGGAGPMVPAPPSSGSDSSLGLMLVAGLTVMTGGGALVGWLIAGSRAGALVGAIAGLGLGSANLAMNAGRLAGESK